MTNKLFIKTMGCQMNVYDSDKMADILRESHGFELTSNEKEADLLLVNTCSIREKAQEKVFSQLGRVWVTGLKPEKNVGSHVFGKIDEIIDRVEKFNLIMVNLI